MNVGVCLYHSKPLGTPKEELEYALYHCYRPLLTYVYTKIQVKLSLHLSGNIFEWLENQYPEINMLIQDLMKRGQLELVGGGFYDPAFPFIPVKDRGMQIEMLNTYLRKRFGKKPQGALISEHFWHPSLITTLNSCDISYVITFDPDEKVRRRREEAWYEPYRMVDAGKSMVIIPASNSMSSMVPKKSPDEVTAALAEAVNRSESRSANLLVSADDLITGFMLSDVGSMIEYIDDLFTLLLHYGSVPVLLSEQLKSCSQGFDYLKSGWYHPSVIHDPYWDFHDVLKRYPESYHAYCRMHYLQRLIAGIRKDRSRKKSADNEVLKSQSSQFFWSSAAGGIYRNVLRKEQHRSFIEAEKMTRERGVFSTSLSCYDMDFDGKDEYIYRGKNIFVVIDRKGASLKELDYLVTSWNYQDTFTGCMQDDCMVSKSSYPERVHQNSAVDLFFLEPYGDISEKYRQGTCRNLEQTIYRLGQYNKEAKTVSFITEGCFQLGEKTFTMALEKLYRFKTNSIEIDYQITNLGEEEAELYFCSEMNLSFGYEGMDFVEIHSIDSPRIEPVASGASLDSVRYLKIHDISNKSQIGIYTKKRFLIMNRNYSTTVNTAYGEEDIYQHSVFRPFWKLELPSKEAWTNTVGLRIDKRTAKRRKITND